METVQGLPSVLSVGQPPSGLSWEIQGLIQANSKQVGSHQLRFKGLDQPTIQRPPRTTFAFPDAMPHMRRKQHAILECERSSLPRRLASAKLSSHAVDDSAGFNSKPQSTPVPLSGRS